MLVTNSMIGLYKDLGFEVTQEGPSIELPEGNKRSVDWELDDDKNSYLALEIEASSVQVFLTAPFHRAFTVLKAFKRDDRYQNHIPFVTVQLDEFDESGVRRIQRQFNNYAPEFEYLIVIDGQSVYRSTDEEWNDELMVENGEDKSEVDLTFSDQELYLTKEIIRTMQSESLYANTKSLSDSVPISQGKVYDWIRALKKREWIKDTDEGIQLSKKGEYLDLWKEQYDWSSNPLVGKFVLSDEIDRWLDTIVEQEESFRKQFAFTHYIPLDLDEIRDLLNTPLRIFWLAENPDHFGEGLNLQEAEEHEGTDVIVREPRFSLSIQNFLFWQGGLQFVGPTQNQLDRSKNGKK